MQGWQPDCLVSDWRLVQNCSMPCLRGVRTWAREILQPASGQASAPCPQLERTEKCGADRCECPVRSPLQVIVRSKSKANETILGGVSVPIIHTDAHETLQLVVKHAEDDNNTHLFYSAQHMLAPSSPEGVVLNGANLSCDRSMSASGPEPLPDPSGRYIVSLCILTKRVTAGSPEVSESSVACIV